jgi:hypothetical protein
LGALALLCALGSPVAAAGITDWYASDGLPSAWGSYGADGTISGGAMTVTHGTGYYQDASVVPGFDTRDGFSIEARVRYVSGSSSLDSRDVIGLFFSQGYTFGTGLFIGDGRVFINDQNVIRGDTAYVDTSGFHTYRIDVAAQAMPQGFSAVSVYYDGALLLTGQTFQSDQANGSVPSFAFGDLSAYASGVSEWQFVRNASVAPVPEPGEWAMIAGGLALAGFAARRRKRLSA